METAIPFLEKLTDKLGLTGERLFAYMVHGEVVSGFITLAVAAALLYAGALATGRAKKLLGATPVEDDDWILYAGLAAISFLVGIITLSHGVYGVLAPEASALAKILSSMR